MSVSRVTLRPIEPEDQPFLLEVYSSTRIEELAPLRWNAAQQAAFLAQQFNAQQQYYQANYSDANYLVILVDDRPAGRLYLARWPNEIRIMDIALLPEYRGAGIGSRLIKELQAEARRVGTPVRIHVEKFNPALRLYQRLGFTPIEDRGVYWFLQWSPDRTAGSDHAVDSG